MKFEDQFELIGLDDVESNFTTLRETMKQASPDFDVNTESMFKLDTVARATKQAVDDANLDPSPDRRHERLKRIATDAKDSLDSSLSRAFARYDDAIKERRNELRAVKESARAREIRDSFAPVLSSGAVISPSELDTETFESLANAPARPVIHSNGTTELRKFFSEDVVEQEFRRRRPAIAEKLDRVEKQRRELEFLTNSLTKLIEKGTGTGPGW